MKNTDLDKTELKHNFLHSKVWHQVLDTENRILKNHEVSLTRECNKNFPACVHNLQSQNRRSRQIRTGSGGGIIHRSRRSSLGYHLVAAYY